MSGYHAVHAIGHFARALQARTKGGRGSFGALAVLQALWLRADVLADAPVVRVDLPDLAGIVSSPERLRQIVAELAEVGAVERMPLAAGRSLRLVKPRLADLDAVARMQIETAAAEAELARAELDRTQRLGTVTTKPERADALGRLGKKPSDVRDLLASMAGVSPGSLRYSGPGSGPVQAAVAWLAQTGATWEQLVTVCEHVKQDRDRPAHEIVWLFGDQHHAYLDRVLAALRPQPDAATLASSASPAEKRLGDLARADVQRWLGHRVKNEVALAELWTNEAAVARLLALTNREALARIQAWQANPSLSLAEHFA